MRKLSPLFHKILLILALFNILMCPLLFVDSVFFPSSMLIILFGVGILGVGLLVTWALIGPNKEPDVPKITMEKNYQWLAKDSSHFR